MKIELNKNGNALIISVSGRLDIAGAPELEKVVNSELEGITDLTFDFKELEYISSAGLRVLLIAIKKMNAQGNMVVKHANDVVMEVFEVTGFIDLMNVE
ncbi:MAG: STAS domain-containing protein [Lachnospiraceae bacterium]|nr:STAS domain-containing protein [Lachnospiraceae bacterium]